MTGEDRGQDDVEVEAPGRAVLIDLMRGVAEGRAEEMLNEYPWLPGFPLALWPSSD